MDTYSNILIVDDEQQILNSFEITLQTAGLENITLCNDSRDVEQIVKTTPIDIALIDLMMPHISGEQLLEFFKEHYPNIPVIIITGKNDLNTAVESMQKGAFDYILKPVSQERLTISVKRAIEWRELTKENLSLKEHVLSGKLKHHELFLKEFTSQSEKLLAIFRYAEAIAASKEPVLITGETGVGKEVMANCIYQLSQPAGNFVSVNIAELDENQFSDTLFGHHKGAFTGAIRNREGLVEKAKDGILFLDEIGDLSEQLQVKLLRLLQEHEYFPLGSDVPKQTNARIIVATNRTIEDLRTAGNFRTDLFYRLRPHHIHLLPLRERKEDIPLLLNKFIKNAAKSLNKKPPSIRPELIPLLNTYHFPGNIRELQGMVTDAVTNHQNGPLSLKIFKRWIAEGSPMEVTTPAPENNTENVIIFNPKLPLPTLKQCQELIIKEALKRSGGNQSIAAGILGITRQALNKRILKLKEKK